MTKAEALELIRANIVTYGHHLYLVRGGPNPRYIYSIGLKDALGAELIFAGAAFYSANQGFEVVRRLASMLKESPNRSKADYSLGELGTFSIREVHPTWSSKLILGALDYYKVPLVPALQIVPGAERQTIDVPYLSRAFSSTVEPIWQWLEKSWEYPVPQDMKVITSLDALRGSPITEAVRWEETDWELFPGCATDVAKEDMRSVPFGTLLGAEPSVKPVTELMVGKALRREPGDLEWNPWGSSSTDDDE
jgi:hypothetical protein